MGVRHGGDGGGGEGGGGDEGGGDKGGVMGGHGGVLVPCTGAERWGFDTRCVLSVAYDTA